MYEGRTEEFWKELPNIDPLLEDLMSKMLASNPDDRIDI